MGLPAVPSVMLWAPIYIFFEEIIILLLYCRIADRLIPYLWTISARVEKNWLRIGDSDLVVIVQVVPVVSVSHWRFVTHYNSIQPLALNRF